MKSSLANSAPALLLASATAILAAAFVLPVGGERQPRTRYQRLAGFAGTFGTPRSAESSPASTRGETWGLVVQAVRQKYTPVQADALLNRVEAFSTSAEKPARRRGRVNIRKPAAPIPTAPVAASTAEAEPAAAVAPPATASAVETADSVGARYENDLSKYPLDKGAAQGPIALRLRGLSRNSGRCILKVAVTNRGDDDFFIRDFVVRDGRDVLAAKSYVRLFVEPGRTREGFVVFDKPRTGADVHVALKEDREKGQVVELPVPYPF